jgi:hypothetical protein
MCCWCRDIRISDLWPPEEQFHEVLSSPKAPRVGISLITGLKHYIRQYLEICFWTLEFNYAFKPVAYLDRSARSMYSNGGQENSKSGQYRYSTSQLYTSKLRLQLRIDGTRAPTVSRFQ